MEKQSESTAEMFQRALQMVAYVPFSELREVGGLWDEETTVLRNRARQYLLDQAMRDPGEEPADA